MQTLGGKLKRKQKAFQRICDLLIDFKEFAFVSNNCYSTEKSVVTFDLKVRLHVRLKLAYFAFHVMLEGLYYSLQNAIIASKHDVATQLKRKKTK
jgi:hypothetical protein